jgi:hypothetical protein
MKVIDSYEIKRRNTYTVLNISLQENNLTFETPQQVHDYFINREIPYSGKVYECIGVEQFAVNAVRDKVGLLVKELNVK